MLLLIAVNKSFMPRTRPGPDPDPTRTRPGPRRGVSFQATILSAAGRNPLGHREKRYKL